jgi:hypothetical protein
VCDCQKGGWELPAFFSEDVVKVAGVPVGDDGTVLAIASDQEGFYRSMQDRGLAMCLIKPSSYHVLK